MGVLEAFVKTCDDVYNHIIKIKELEEEKRLHLLSYNIDKANAVLKMQQALTMELENLETKRITAQKNAGFENLTSSEILKKLDSEDRVPLENAFSKLVLAADDLQVLNKISLDIANTELRLIDNISSDLPKPIQSVTYSSMGKKNVRNFSSYDGKI